MHADLWKLLFSKNTISKSYCCLKENTEIYSKREIILFISHFSSSPLCCLEYLHANGIFISQEFISCYDIIAMDTNCMQYCEHMTEGWGIRREKSTSYFILWLCFQVTPSTKPKALSNQFITPTQMRYSDLLPSKSSGQ